MKDNTYDDLVKAWESYIQDIKNQMKELENDNKRLREIIRNQDEQIRKLSVCGVC